MSTQMPTPSGTDSYRNVAAIVIALAILQTATGALSVVGPLTLVSQGAGPLKIGAIVSSYALGFLLGARLAPREIMQVWYNRSDAIANASEEYKSIYEYMPPKSRRTSAKAFMANANAVNDALVQRVWPELPDRGFAAQFIKDRWS